MEQNFNEIDDEQAYLERRAKRKERMLREKRRRQKRKFMFLTGAGILGLCLAVVLIAGAFGKKSKAHSEEQYARKQ